MMLRNFREWYPKRIQSHTTLVSLFKTSARSDAILLQRSPSSKLNTTYTHVSLRQSAPFFLISSIKRNPAATTFRQVNRSKWSLTLLQTFFNQFWNTSTL
jgi:hypothetical protein